MAEMKVAAKVPQDHQLAADKPRVVTAQGVEVTIDPKIFDDYELVEESAQMQENPTIIVAMLHKILGSQYEQVKEALRGDDGIVSVEAMAIFFAEVMQKAAPNS
jgi:hypothetical protein